LATFTPKCLRIFIQPHFTDIGLDYTVAFNAGMCSVEVGQDHIFEIVTILPKCRRYRYFLYVRSTDAKVMGQTQLRIIGFCMWTADVFSHIVLCGHSITTEPGREQCTIFYSTSVGTLIVIKYVSKTSYVRHRRRTHVASRSLQTTVLTLIIAL